ncbi:TIGR00266 family protein [Lachnospiraceae bacterium]|nr:TIGR00266 family protein [Lachnospiraceae bacterium]
MNYQIDGGTLPVVIINLDAGEKVVTEGGGMSWMSPNMKMETSGGGLGKMFSRAVSGESVFQNIYTAEGGPGFIACASSFPGSIRAFEIGPGNNMVFQKSAFLASVGNIELSVHFKKKLGAGMFGGEGFIMQKVSGQGVAFAEFDGHVVEYDLQPGQQIVLDTGHLAAMSETCQMDIQTVKGLKNIAFGGEGLFNTVVTGPGHVWVQTMPASSLAGAIQPYIVTSN